MSNPELKAITSDQDLEPTHGLYRKLLIQIKENLKALMLEDFIVPSLKKIILKLFKVSEKKIAKYCARGSGSELVKFGSAGTRI